MCISPIIFYKKGDRLSALFPSYWCGRLAAEWLIAVESAFRGTIYEPYDFLTDHTHTLVIHANPAVLESGALSGKKRSKGEMDTLSRAAADTLRIHLQAEIHMQTLPAVSYTHLSAHGAENL